MKNNAQLIAEYKELSRQMKEFIQQDRLAETRKLTPRIQELYQLIDWGYRVGEEVERWAGKTWQRDRIVSIKGNEFKFNSVILPHQLIRKKTEKLEQMSFF